MIKIKSKREIALLQIAGQITHYAHVLVARAIKPGISTAELDEIAEKAIREMGATPSFKHYQGFPATICASINEEVIHGIPSKRRILRDGDIISVDIGAKYKGYHGDCARTHIVGAVAPAVERLVATCEAAFWEGMKFARPGEHLSNISHAIQKYVEQAGYGIVREFTGHGVGQELHEDPYIPNYGAPDQGPILKPGMVIAVEPMITMGKPDIRIKADGWTVVPLDRKLSAHYENTLVITDEGYEILTTGGEELVQK